MARYNVTVYASSRTYQPLDEITLPASSEAAAARDAANLYSVQKLVKAPGQPGIYAGFNAQFTAATFIEVRKVA